ncbi:TatD family hydrolase [Sulfuriferula sp.]|uniref:TatD family hydrolase n=1 Tax=Sulfuriferula sp. TaxID=2025307 RepID=UPI00272F52D2|nr:TatD family hydrolase [Sulfuriferula sp.]MDP2024580.1 TatD family hydrolase [Sulfuriferula sp.]
MTLIDTHCHLDAAEFDEDRTRAIQRAQQNGVAMIVVPAVQCAAFAAVLALHEQHAACAPALGLHPMYIHAHLPEHLILLRAAIERQRPVAIGEIGLDFFVPNLDVATQEYYFTEQLKIARDFGLPVLLHSRRANDQVLKQLRRFDIQRGIAHAFSGSRQQADAFIQQGFKLGFGGAMTYTRASNLRRLAAELPLEAIVLETDAPDMAPAWIQHQRNSPQQLPAIAAVLAELRGVGFDKIAQATTVNARVAIPALAALDAPPAIST